MKKLILSVLLLASTCSYAQKESNWDWDWDFNQSTYTPILYTPKEHVNEINFTVQKKNGKFENYQKTFNPDGKLLTLSTYDKNDNKIPVVEYKYDANNWVTSSKSYKKGKLKKQVFITRLNKRKPLEIIKKDAKNQIIYKKKWEYDSDQCVTRSEQYKKQNKLYRVWEYDYFSPCDKSKSTLKNGKSKVLHTWNYDCKKEGEKTVQKNELQVCKYEETSKEYLTKVKEKTNSKGEVFRTIQKFTIKDTLLLESKSLDAEGRLTHLTTFDKDVTKPLVSKNYRKGKLRYGYEYTYVDGNVTSKKLYFKGEIRYTYTYQYKDNKMVEQKQLDEKKKVIRKVSLSYS